MQETRRSFLPHVPGPSPWLVFPSGKDRDIHNFFNISDPNKRSILKNFRKVRERCCLVSMHGWLVIRGFEYENYWTLKKDICFLWNPDTSGIIRLPSTNLHDIDRFNACILTSPPTDPDCMVLLVGNNFFLFWQLGDKQWTKQYYTVNHNPYDIINKVITCSNGTIYAFTASNDIFATINREGCGTMSIRWFQIERPRHYSEAHRFWSYMVESYGEIYYVFLHHIGEHDPLKYVEIFKMDFTKMAWVTVESLGETVFFLSKYGNMSLSVANSGIKGNTIHFAEKNSLYVFGVGDESLSVYLPCLNLQAPVYSPFWLMPSNRLVKVYKENANTTIWDELEIEKTNKIVKVTKERVEESEGSYWIDLPRDILLSIAQHLPSADDYMNFRPVCKKWASIPPIRWTTDTTGVTTQYPWLMYSNRKKSTCSFIDPVFNVTHCVDRTELRGARICFSKDGWLLMSKGDRSMFFFNPFTKVTIDLPDLPRDFAFRGLSFSSLPTSADCIVFGVNTFSTDYVRIDYVRLGNQAWTDRLIANHVKILLGNHNPVFYDGAFYCLSYERHLGVFDFKNNICEWRILTTPLPKKSFDQNYLVECNGEILSVFVGRNGSWVEVHKFDFSTKKWTKLRSLGDKMLFISRSTSMLLKATNKRNHNKIYFPISYNDENNCVFYSLETRKWHSSFGDFCREDIYNTKEQLHCTWIQPTLSWKNHFL
ncbi:hypothetical protein IFM89_016533 [Coptis chinensis]|uniref:F-box domain-containing protein n=1 Tax=Coptis chinensis TaxID=261450 RepID=A0A835MBN5_9MAGN|nr:hypothetical protein IFM89_016533 [Coptis chinensis]